MVTLDKNNVYFPAINLAINDVSGSVSFDDELIQASNLMGDLFGGLIDFNIEGKTKANGDYITNANFSGDWNAKQLLQHNDIPLLDKDSGNLDWVGKLELLFEPGKMNYELQVSSNLQSLGSTLPYPLTKAEGDKGLLLSMLKVI